ncbi:hypothetical protein WA026_006730 [Henosepilachna vigintioctopunctata]|uniref:Ionotropic receptor n=1 Tax=Henosepilachna vigintioctopunctata TaxID=420089 RepID=A0AAW1UG68_9CUCU
MNFSILRQPSALNVIQCLRIFFSQYFSSSDLMCVVSKNNYYHLFASLRFDYSEAIDIWDFNVDHPNDAIWYFYPNHPDFYVLDGLTEQEFQVFINNMSDDPSFNPQARYLFLGSNFTSNLLHVLNDKFISNAVFFDVETGNLFIHFPYKKKSVNVKDHNFYQSAVCEKNGNLKVEQDLFPPKEPKVWKNSTLSVLYVPSEVYSICDHCENKGVEMDCHILISTFFDIKLEFHRNEDLVNFGEDEYNVFFGGQLVQDFGLFTMPYLRDEVTFFVPVSQLLSRWKYIFSIFPLSVWSLWFATVTLTTATWIMGDFILQQRICLEGLIAVPFIIFHWFLEKSFKIRRKSTFETILIILMLFLSNIMNIYFKSRFTYLLNGLNYEWSIDTFDDIISRKLKIGGTQHGINLINSSVDVANYLQENYMNCRGTQCLQRTAIERDMAALAMVSVARSTSNNFVDNTTGRLLLKRINWPSFHMYVCSFFNRGHPMFPLFNRSLQRLAESGILMKIYFEYVRKNIIQESSMGDTQKLNFEHIVAPLTMWCIGIITSFVVFFCEMAHAKKRSMLCKKFIRVTTN